VLINSKINSIIPVTRVGDTLNPTTSRAHNQSPQTHWGNGYPIFGSYRNHSCIDIRTGFLPWSEDNRIELHAVISLANDLSVRLNQKDSLARC